jgi:hypothetical protein
VKKAESLLVSRSKKDGTLSAESLPIFAKQTNLSSHVPISNFPAFFFLHRNPLRPKPARRGGARTTFRRTKPSRHLYQLDQPAALRHHPAPPCERSRGQFLDVELVNATGTTLNGYFDSGLDANETYEYAVERKTGNITAYGYAFANFFKPVVDTRGKLLVFIDSTTADLLGADLVTFKNDLRGEGWHTVPFKTGPFTSVQWVKNQIVAAYNADPTWRESRAAHGSCARSLFREHGLGY